MFWIKAKNLEERTKLISYLKKHEVGAVFHYIPLHSAPAGVKWGEFRGNDRNTTVESERILRLPLYYKLSKSDVERVSNCIYSFYRN